MAIGTTDTSHRGSSDHGDGLMDRAKLEQDSPRSPTHMDRKQWWETLKRTVREFQDDGLTDWAAALTYYGVLAIFPA